MVIDDLSQTVLMIATCFWIKIFMRILRTGMMVSGPTSCKKFLGPKYALLRFEFRNARKKF